jgi:hypothetical protein
MNISAREPVRKGLQVINITKMASKWRSGNAYHNVAPDSMFIPHSTRIKRFDNKFTLFMGSKVSILVIQIIWLRVTSSRSLVSIGFNGK